jgi:Tol biopolymer transport system component
VVFISNATNLVGNAVSSGFHVYRYDLSNGTRQLMDVDMSGVGSTDDELACLGISADGSCVAFTSPDGSLVPLDKNRAEDVFVRDVSSAATELISQRNSSVVHQSGDAYSSLSQLSVSADGRWVAFASTADDLVASDTNGVQDVFVRDLQTGSSVLVSVGFDGSAASGVSENPVISADGHSVAFISNATNLVAGQSGSGFNVFLRNLETTATILVSVSTNPTTATGAGTPYCGPVISANGRYVAYVAEGAVSGNAVLGTYWRDVTSPSAVLLGQLSQGVPPFPMTMSENGRYVAYSLHDAAASPRDSLRVRDTQAGIDIYTNAWTPFLYASQFWAAAALSPDGSRLLYVINRTLYVNSVPGNTNLLSVPSAALVQNAAGWSEDGRYLAFVSSTNLLSSGDDGTNKAYLCDLQTGDITLMGVTGPSTGIDHVFSDSPAVSADGRFVVYRSGVTNYLVGDTSMPPNLFLFDRLSGSTTLLTAGQGGVGPATWVSRGAISGSGNTVAFLDLGSGLVSGDLNEVQDAFAAAPNIGSPLDSDGDGIPDWWMLLYFGHATGQASDLSRAGDDADGDGMSNWQEWIAGTDPKDASSRLQMLLPVRNASGVSLSWESVAGTTYYIQRSTLKKGDSFSTIQTNITSQASTTFFTDTNTVGQGQLFYRVGVQ